jgi:hypothetical protein
VRLSPEGGCVIEVEHRCAPPLAHPAHAIKGLPCLHWVDRTLAGAPHVSPDWHIATNSGQTSTDIRTTLKAKASATTGTRWRIGLSRDTTVARTLGADIDDVKAAETGLGRARDASSGAHDAARTLLFHSCNLISPAELRLVTKNRTDRTKQRRLHGQVPASHSPPSPRCTGIPECAGHV